MKLDLRSLLPNRPEDTDIQHIELGDHGYPALVVDGFYRHPEHVRAFALALRYRAPVSQHPGYVALASLDLEPFMPFFYERVGHWYYTSAQSMDKACGNSFFFQVLRREGEPGRPPSSRPHVDTNCLAAMVYLNKPEQCRGGTSFYRHRETGAYALLPMAVMDGRCPGGPPGDQSILDLTGRDRLWQHGAKDAYGRAAEAGIVDSYPAYWQRIMDTPGDEGRCIIDTCDGWDLMRVIEMKYNRLVVFPAFLLHSGHYQPKWFGNTPQSCRLTQNFFFQWPALPGPGGEASPV